ncbi:MAG: amidophosphoribosyltransferase [Aerococcus sp.]|nr:amidophosphoribosyltransferase [Aerococcus sp.]
MPKQLERREAQSVTTARHLRSVNEAGGLFAIKNHPMAARMTYFALRALQHRGQQGAGIITSESNEFKSYRGNGLITSVFNDEAILDDLQGVNAIGQVRAATTDDRSDDTNIQPRLYQFNDETMAVAHVGNLTNGASLRDDLEATGAVLSSNSAAELFIHLIRKYRDLDFEQAFKAALLELKGGFDFCLLTENALYAAVDHNSFRPLVIGKLDDAYFVTSETCVLHTIGAEYVRELFAGEYVVIDDEGYRIERYAKDCQVAIEPMEYIYYARPDSDIAGVNVHTARKETGKRLAQECPAPNADIVIGVPNSSLSAASGYAEASGLPYELGLIKNQYTGRTFIQPTQEMREKGVRTKLSAVPNIIKGKRIVLVDDSIVRGTTIRRIIRLLKDSGAKEIHVRIASPALRFPNYFGIDVSHARDMVASNQTITEMNARFGSDSLGFISVQGLLEAINTPFKTANRGISLDAFDGKPSADIADYEAEFKAELTPLQVKIIKGEFQDE